MKKIGLKLIWIAILASNIVCGYGFAETGHDEVATGADTAQPGPAAFRVNAAMYSARKQDFRNFCASIAADGRLESFSNMIVQLLDNNLECLECKAFFKTLVSTCKPAGTKPPDAKHKKKKKVVDHATEEEATPTPEATPIKKPLQREPNGLLLDYASTIFAGIANSSLGEITLKPFDMLLVALRDPADKAVGEHEYFVTLADYMDSGYIDVRKEVHANSSESEKDSVVNSLFNN